MNVSSLDDIMKYYLYTFAPFYFFTLVGVILTVLAFKNYRYGNSGIIVTGFNIISLFCQAMFIGVLADNNAKNHQEWITNTIVLIIVNIIIIVSQIVIIKMRKEK